MFALGVRMSSVGEYLLLHLVSCRAPAVPRIARNFDIFLPHNEFRLFLLPGNGDVFNSLFDQNLIPLRLLTFDLCQQNPAIKAAS